MSKQSREYAVRYVAMAVLLNPNKEFQIVASSEEEAKEIVEEIKNEVERLLHIQDN